MIHATCHTADNVVCLEFDATPWFSEADAPSIIDLAQREWTSPAIAESLERRRGYERLHDLMEYAAKRLQEESPRIRPGKPSSVSSTGRKPWPGSRRTGLRLWHGFRASAGESTKTHRL